LLEIDAQDSWLLQGGGYSMYNKIKKTQMLLTLVITLFL